MKDNDSVFPIFDATSVNSDGTPCKDYGCSDYGVTIKQYAAIHLRVSMSGDPELDKMIRESRRLDFAGQAMEGMLAGNEEGTVVPDGKTIVEFISYCSLKYANALLAKWEKEAGE
jgi:hypothetical protein